MPQFIDDRTLVVDGVSFACEYPVRDAQGGLPVMKDRDLVERTIALVEEVAPRRLLEVGVWRGGSTALLASLARPERLVAIELMEEPVAVLHEHLAQTGLAVSVDVHYGVDQGDAPTVARILDEAFGDGELDLVIDDGSHIYTPTLTTFDLAFPRLREGGVYVIEDWNGEHALGDALAARLDESGQRRPEDAELWSAVDARASDPDRDDPVTRLALELVMARASAGDLIRSVSVEAHWIVVVRGSAPLGPGGFHLLDHVHDHNALLARQR